MSATDRELLELAAGAFGVPAREEGGYLFAAPGEISKTGWGIVTWCGLGSVQFWNPLESNDDTLRLAVKLTMSVEFNGDDCDACATNGDWVSEPHGDDPQAATRRAIVRAAAAIARAS